MAELKGLFKALKAVRDAGKSGQDSGAQAMLPQSAPRPAAKLPASCIRLAGQNVGNVRQYTVSNACPQAANFQMMCGAQSVRGSLGAAQQRAYVYPTTTACALY